jgi:hypothetical protein
MLIFRLPRKVFTNWESGRFFWVSPSPCDWLVSTSIGGTFRKQAKPLETTSHEEASAALAQPLIASRVKPCIQTLDQLFPH